MKKSVLLMTNDEYDFSLENGDLEISVSEVNITVDKEGEFPGYFEIKSLSETPAKGFVCSSNSRIHLVSSFFNGFSARIEFYFSSFGLQPGDESLGEIVVQSDKGEYVVPVKVLFSKSFNSGSMGPIKNLFHFANLAKTSWDEAAELFYSESFINILDGNDKMYIPVYKALSEKKGSNRALDEFLVAVKKKSPVTMSVDNKVFVITNPVSDVTKEIVLSLGSWGYASAKVSADEDFIYIDEKEFGIADFKNNSAVITFTIDRQKLYKGRNYGKITIETSSGENIYVDVVVDNHSVDVRKNAEFISAKSDIALTKDYIAFRLGKMTLEEWVKKSGDSVDHISGSDENIIKSKLYKVQLLVAADRLMDAKYIMDSVEPLISEGRISNELNAYFLYLSSLLTGDSSYVDKIAHKIKKIYSRNEYSWRLAWMMLYMQEDLYYKPDKKWNFLEEQFKFDGTGPVLYTEAIGLLNENPSLMEKLTEYEITLLNFALKEDALTATLAERVGFLAGRAKDFNDVVYRVLKTSYDKNPSVELLTAIINYIMKGKCLGPEYFKWYEKGVLAEIRITGLYECYMNSLDLKKKTELPKMILMYFAYQNSLDYERRAYLYANVYEYRAKYPEIAASYRESLDDFIKEQIIEENINPNLITLYQKYLISDLVDEEMAPHLCNILFTYEVKAPSDKYTSAVLYQDMISYSKSYPVKDKVAYLPIYSSSYNIYWEDEEGNRYVSDSFVAPVKIINAPSLLDKVLKLDDEKYGLMFYKCFGSGREITVTQDNFILFKRLYDSTVLDEVTRKNILLHLLRYAFDRDDMSKLDELLELVNIGVLEGDEFGELIHILVAIGRYDESFEYVRKFGPEHVSGNTMLRLLSRLLERTDFEYNEDMVGLCAFIYAQGKYDGNILKYLADYKEGSLEYLKGLYKDAGTFGVECYQLLERILITCIFVACKLKDRSIYYKDYVEAHGSTGLELAFLAQNAYEYLVNETLIDELYFGRMSELCKEGEELPRVVALALLKHQSGQGDIRWDVGFINSTIQKEIQRGCVFPFFVKFAKVCPGVIELQGRSYVEYRGNPSSRVIIHYAIPKGSKGEMEYRKEEMDHLYGGLFVKSFVLFCGGEVQYYITEQTGNKEQLTSSSVLERKENEEFEDKWRYTMLNEGLIAKEMKDYDTAAQNLLDYIRNDYLAGEIFGKC